jgi:hypothetical protein
MGVGFPGPKPHHAGQWRRIVRRPVHRSRLLFHDPPAALADGAVKVVVKGLKVGIALTRIGALMLGRCSDPVLKEPERVTVPGGDFQIVPHLEVIEIRDPAHIVVADRSMRMRPDNLNLTLVETHHLV